MFTIRRLAAKAVITTAIAIRGAVNLSNCDDRFSYPAGSNKWRQFCDLKTGQIYYHNEETNETVWDLPTLKTTESSDLITQVQLGNIWDSNWDMREDSKSKVLHQIVMIRHGQYVSGEKDSDRVLTELGKKQADTTGKRLNALLSSGQLSPISTMYFSTMQRATETCQIILPNIKLTTGSNETRQKPFTIEACSMIREGAVHRISPLCNGWEPTDEDFEKEGARVLAAFKNHIHRAGKGEDANYSTVLVCHGNVIRYFVMKALQLPPEAWLRLNVYNGSITILEVRGNGNVSLRTLGDTGHFPTDLITYN